MEKENQLMHLSGSNLPSSFNFFDPVQFDTMQRVCKLFANSELVPDMYKVSEKNSLDKAMANCIIAVEMGQRIGASPLMIMQNMVIIYGRPSWSSKFLIATVNTCGRFNPLQFRITSLGMVGKVEYVDYIWNQQTRRKEAVKKEFDGTKIDNLQFVAYTTAKGSDAVLESSPIDIRMAIQEGWYTKAGSKWTTMTKQMGMYRAASFWTSAYAPELSMGMKTTEEVQDIIDVDYVDVTEKVEKEKAENANKETIKMDTDKSEPDKSEEPVVDEKGQKEGAKNEPHEQKQQESTGPGF